MLARRQSRLLILSAHLMLSVGWTTAAHADADSARANGVAWLLKHQGGDGSWTSSDGSLPMQATSLALTALDTAGLARAPAYAAARAYVGNADVDSIDSIARKASVLALTRSSAAAQTEVDRLYAQRLLQNLALWSSYGASGTDTVDTALAWQALRTADAGYANHVGTVLNGVCSVAAGLQAQASGLAAPVNTPGATNFAAAPASIGKPSVLATALLLQEFDQLGRSYSGNLACGSSNYSFAGLVQSLGTWLLTQQNADGGFGEPRSDGGKGPSSIMVTAITYGTLSRLAQPQSSAAASALAWLQSRQDPAGHWGSDALLTAQVLAIWPYSAAAVADANRDGIPDSVASALGGASTQLGSRDLLTPPTLPSAAPHVFSGAQINSYYAPGPTATIQSFNPKAVLQPPFRVTAGSLPPGMVLDASSGQIYGTPTASGSYSFQLSDNAGNTSWDRIDVASKDPQVVNSGAVPLPLWSQGLLGLGLAVLLRRRALRVPDAWRRT